MESTVNSIYLIGTLRSDPEKVQADTRMPQCIMDLVTRDSYPNRSGERVETSETHTVIASGRLAETCYEYLSSGRQVYVEGSLRTRSRKENGVEHKEVEVQAKEVTFLGRSNQTENTAPDRPTDTAGQRSANTSGNDSQHFSGQRSAPAEPDFDSFSIDHSSSPRTCDWCDRPVSYSDAAYDLCSSCSDQMLGD